MNFDRFGFKAKSQRHQNWLYATLDLYSNCYGVRYHFEQGGDCAYSPTWIKPETICQCTGLRDSDGNLIYENDIIRSFDGDKTADFIVRFNENDLAYEVVGKTGGCCCLAFVKYWIEHGDRCIVVGNVFDKEEREKK